jgi:hypothetical protein
MNLEEFAGYCNNPERDAGNTTALYATQFANTAMSADYRFVPYRRYNGAELLEEALVLLPTALVETFEGGSPETQENMLKTSIMAIEAAINDLGKNSFIYWFTTLSA